MMALYLESADSNYDVAQANLGDCYFYGLGVEKDVSKAKGWYQLAASKGNKTAIDALKGINSQSPTNPQQNQ